MFTRALWLQGLESGTIDLRVQEPDDHQNIQHTWATASLHQGTQARFSKPQQNVNKSLDTLDDDDSDAFEPLELHTEASDQQSDEQDAFEERADDRANDPACIQCDDGGILEIARRLDSHASSSCL